jgi:hypothetical protein
LDRLVHSDADSHRNSHVISLPDRHPNSNPTGDPNEHSDIEARSDQNADPNGLADADSNHRTHADPGWLASVGKLARSTSRSIALNKFQVSGAAWQAALLPTVPKFRPAIPRSPLKF